MRCANFVQMKDLAALHAIGTAFLLASLRAAPLPAVELSFYLPENVSYDPTIPKPSSVLGFEVGEWHVRHDQIVEYARALAAASPRVHLEEIGRTYEEKPLLVLIISSRENLARLEELRQEHEAFTRPGAAVNPSSPVVVYLGYSVHGNESSGANASLLVAYHLAAATGAGIDTLLSNTIVLLDPALNPDGLQRFATWANMYRGRQLVGDARHREHQEGWPSGRTNHYWFDLNRDYLPAVHPESRASLRVFHRWNPNVFADFHEMGSDATFFFQPGVPSRKNPWTPPANVDLTRAIAAHHARVLDERGLLYFSEEVFDDFYYGKGSTYPDVNGGVGILYEQASSRGHLRNTVHGPLTFPATIRNQFLISLSTLRGALDVRQDLLRYQKQFYDEALDLARRDAVKAYIFGDEADRAHTFEMLQMLQRHAIVVHSVARDLEKDGHRFPAGSSFVVPLEQPQYRLIKSLFEPQTSFEDSIFYDVSAWTLPLAMGIPCNALGRLPGDLVGEVTGPMTFPVGHFSNVTSPYAFAFAWSESYAPRALQHLLHAGVVASVATKPFQPSHQQGSMAFERGTIVVPLGGQSLVANRIVGLMQEIARDDGIDVQALSSGWTDEGVDLGSGSFRVLREPKPVLLVGRGVSSYNAGEIWHLLDQRYDFELPLLNRDDLRESDLDGVTHVILVDGDHDSISEDVSNALARWIRDGGVLIATKRAARWAAKKQLIKIDFTDADTRSTGGKSPTRLPYAERSDRAGAQEIGGAFFAVDLDLTHPLAYGYRSSRLAVFRDHRLIMQPSADPYGNVALYTATPLLAGYVSSANLERIKGTASVVAERLGRGAVILFVDDPNFRSYVVGTNRMFLNALFFGPILEAGGE